MSNENVVVVPTSYIKVVEAPEKQPCMIPGSPVGVKRYSVFIVGQEGKEMQVLAPTLSLSEKNECVRQWGDVLNWPVREYETKIEIRLVEKKR